MDAKRSSRRKHGGDDGRAPIMPAAFRTRTPDAPATLALRARHLDGDDAARDALFVHYLPVAVSGATRLKFRNPALYAEPLDELVSDGCVGIAIVLTAARRNGITPAVAGASRHWVYREARRAVRREVLGRRGTPDTRRRRSLNAVAERRSAFVQREGRVPSRTELVSVLAGVITNPLLYVENNPACHGADAPPADGGPALASTLPDTREPAVDAGLLGRETMRVAIEGLAGTDRTLLRALLDGESIPSVARKLGITNRQARRRPDGVLWEARAREDLARYLGVAPAERPAERRRHLAAVSQLPPARKVG